MGKCVYQDSRWVVTPLKDECEICGRVLSTRRLRRCERCKHLFCYDCMTPDVATGDRTMMLCLNCARRVVSPRSFSKYGGLTQHLKFRAAFTGLVKLSFARIDGLIGTNLPMAAYRNETWWANTTGSVHAKAWMEAGWEVQEINLKEGHVVFKKVRQIASSKKSRRKSSSEIKKPFTPVPVHSYKPKVPSKTKVSRLYARIKNMERQRSDAYGYRRGFKPRPQHEKRLFGSKEKPQ